MAKLSRRQVLLAGFVTGAGIISITTSHFRRQINGDEFAQDEQGSEIAYEAESYKVLVVMSYEEDYPWCGQIKEGISSVLGDNSEITYFYMDTKTNVDGGPKKAEEAYELYQKLQPDGVIAVDDNVQSMFVVPFLKDKVDTPIMFCGVNGATAELGGQKYGYPATNVSGIVERSHMLEAIVFAKELLPSIEKVGFLMTNVPTTKSVIAEIELGLDTYPTESCGITVAETLDEAVAASKSMKEHCDALFLTTLAGMKDKDGNVLDEKVIVPALVESFRKPTLCDDSWRVAYGAMLSVVKSGQEQGQVSAEMLLKSMQGKAVAELPLTTNKLGTRIVNTDTLEALGIKLDSKVLDAIEKVSTAE